GSGTLTSASSSSAASREPHTSRSWAPTRLVGFREVIGSWNTAPAWARRASRRCCGDAATMSAPPRLARPLTMASAGSSPSAASPSTLLPDPDSPTTPTISPADTDRSTPRSAFTPPGKLTARLLASNAAPPADGSLPASGSAVRRPGISGTALGVCPLENLAQRRPQHAGQEVRVGRRQRLQQEPVEHRQQHPRLKRRVGNLERLEQL